MERLKLYVLHYSYGDQDQSLVLQHFKHAAILVCSLYSVIFFLAPHYSRHHPLIPPVPHPHVSLLRRVPIPHANVKGLSRGFANGERRVLTDAR